MMHGTYNVKLTFACHAVSLNNARTCTSLITTNAGTAGSNSVETELTKGFNSVLQLHFAF